MAVPRNRTSNARKNSRRAHHAKKPKHISACSKCGSPHMPHTICSSCGWYQNRVVVEMREESE